MRLFDKKEGQKYHAIKRARQRYGVEFTGADLARIAQEIKSNNSTLVESSTLRVSKHLVEYRGRTYLVAYDRNRHTVCTFLPMSEIQGD